MIMSLSVIISSLNATNASFIMGFIVFVSSHRDTASQNGKGRNISVSRLRYSANHNALDNCPIRKRLASQNDELCKNRLVSERRSIEGQQWCRWCMAPSIVPLMRCSCPVPLAEKHPQSIMFPPPCLMVGM